MKDSIVIRKLKQEDCTRIQEINKTSLGYEFDLGSTKKQLQRIIETTNDQIFVAEIEQQVVGYIHVASYECTYCDSLKNIMALAVACDYQGYGIGKRLLQEAEAWAIKEGSVGIRLVSSEKRLEAHKFYLRCGYSQRKTQKNFIKYF